MLCGDIVDIRNDPQAEALPHALRPSSLQEFIEIVNLNAQTLSGVGSSFSTAEAVDVADCDARTICDFLVRNQ